MKSEYVLYKGEKVMMIGTAEALAKRLNVKKETIYFYSCPANKKRDKGNRLVAVKVN